uniref:Uncharacterized protein n=1 Tax=Anguilla anguilla TaxID=7936 RepID=A0A0E9WTQ5_ANGAN
MNRLLLEVSHRHRLAAIHATAKIVCAKYKKTQTKHKINSVTEMPYYPHFETFVLFVRFVFRAYFLCNA